MITLSTAQSRTLASAAEATDNGSPFMPPHGPAGRPAKYLKKFGLIEERDGIEHAFWITEHGRNALARIKGTAPAVTTHNQESVP